jgi:hypothetical protein
MSQCFQVHSTRVRLTLLPDQFQPRLRLRCRKGAADRPGELTLHKVYDAMESDIPFIVWVRNDQGKIYRYALTLFAPSKR